MNNFTFTPTSDQIAPIRVLFLEDARADYAPYYSAAEHGRTILSAKQEVFEELTKLGADQILFIEGFYDNAPRQRYGYEIRFGYLGGTGRMQVAGLPIRLGVTEKKIVQVRVQALMNVRDWLKAALTAQVFAPGSYPLMQYLLVGESSKTLAEAAIEARGLPDMNPRLTSGGK